MEFKIKSKFEIGDKVSSSNTSLKNMGKVIDIILNHTDSDYENSYKVRYLVELQDRSRMWFSENYLKKE